MVYPFSFDHLVIAIYLCLLVLAAVNDAATYRIPNRISLAVGVLYPVHVLAAPEPVPWMAAAAIAAAVFLGGGVLFARRVLGGGDVKLMAAVALWAGPAGVLGVLVVTALAGGAMALLMMSPLRFGLALALDEAGQPAARDAVLESVLPYGVAIAAGGIAVCVGVLAR